LSYKSVGEGKRREKKRGGGRGKPQLILSKSSGQKVKTGWRTKAEIRGKKEKKRKARPGQSGGTRDTVGGEGPDN